MQNVGRMVLGLMVLLAGCPWAGVPEMLVRYDFEQDPDGDGTLATARPVTWFADVAVVTGGISYDAANLAYVRSFLPGEELVGNFVPEPSEVDVFDLGWLRAGETISLTHTSLAEQIALRTRLGQTQAAEVGLAVAFALVDADGMIVGYPGASAVAAPADGRYFIVVQTGTESVQLPFDYRLTIVRGRSEAASPRPGTLLLVFDGGADLGITFGGSTVDDVIRIDELPPFDLEQARPDLPGQTERFKKRVRQFTEAIYADYDVLVTLDRVEAEAAGHYDAVVFTSVSGEDLGFDHTPLGIEPLLDIEDRGQQIGIVFIQAANDDRQAMDFNAFCAYWATVAAHEYGHAVGLWHVEQDSEALMTPKICGSSSACVRGLKALAAARLFGSRLLVQDPDGYLSRVLGRRGAAESAAIRQRVEDVLGE